MSETQTAVPPIGAGKCDDCGDSLTGGDGRRCPDCQARRAARRKDARIGASVMGWVWVTDGTTNWLVVNAQYAADRWVLNRGSCRLGYTEGGEEDVDFYRLADSSSPHRDYKCPPFSTDIAAAWQVAARMQTHPAKNSFNVLVAGACIHQLPAAAAAAAIGDIALQLVEGYETMKPTCLQLSEWRALAAATPGPWMVRAEEAGDGAGTAGPEATQVVEPFAGTCGPDVRDVATAETPAIARLIAAAPTAITVMYAEIMRLRAVAGEKYEPCISCEGGQIVLLAATCETCGGSGEVQVAP